MRRLVGMAVAVLALAPGCKRKARPEATPTTPPTAAAADAAPRVPAPTAPDPGYEARRDELLRRGDPARMQPAPVYQEPAAPEASAAEMIKVVSRDVMMVGAIRVDLKAGVAELPARISVVVGPLEYVAVTDKGKAYESLLTVSATAVELRLALTLLGHEGTTPAEDGTVAAPTAADTVLVALRAGKKEQPLADVLVDRRTGKALPDAPWQVIGFRDADRTAALRTLELMTLVPRDRIAPLRLTVDAGNPYAGPDQGLVANGARVPPPGSPVTLILKRRPGAPPSGAPSPSLTTESP